MRLYYRFEREYTSKWAGLRTHILVVMGACVFTILSIYAFPKFMVNGAQMAVGDSARVAAQIITGIGFIGGGTVLRHGASVFGLTTAASLWLSASVGMALGTGDYYIALVATIFCVFVLVFVRKFQDVVIKPNRKSINRRSHSRLLGSVLSRYKKDIPLQPLSKASHVP